MANPPPPQKKIIILESQLKERQPTIKQLSEKIIEAKIYSKRYNLKFLSVNESQNVSTNDLLGKIGQVFDQLLI